MNEATVCKNTGTCRLQTRVSGTNKSIEIQTFVLSFLLFLFRHLKPRDAFFGGQTNAAALYYKTDTSIGEEIKYVDVTSLYPFINTAGEYPMGHPEIITRPDSTDITRFFGVAKVDVIPPYSLYHPVLPFRYGKTNPEKLTFPLCRSCVESEMSKDLTHVQCTQTDTNRQKTLTNGTIGTNGKGGSRSVLYL